MQAFGLSFLALTGAGLAALGVPAVIGAPAHDAAAPSIEAQVAELARRSEAANAALMRGDIDRYNELVTYTKDFTLLSPFGGAPSRGDEYTPERIERMGRFFRNGTLEQELVAAYGSADMVVLAVIERSHVEVGGLPAQDWGLRVTLVWRREGAEWRLAHRHADPLAGGVSLEEAAALAR